MNIIHKQPQRGAVSIFVVIFATLLITVVTVSFIRIMIQDQDQAARNDLSQSAYDSAQAGVEDAKRALLRYTNACSTSTTSTECMDARQAVSSTECNKIVRFGNVIGNDPTNKGEVPVQQTTDDRQLDQAYTCVTAELTTKDVIGNPKANESVLVPLRTEPSKQFDTVTVEWFHKDNLGPSSDGKVDLTRNIESPMPLVDKAKWPANRPSVMRVQLMQVGESFTLNDFDAPVDGKSNANTLFLYPTSSGVALSSAEFTGKDGRRDDKGVVAASPTDAPLPVRCRDVTSGGYSCKMSLKIPEPIGGGVARQGYLRLTPLYNGAKFSVTLSNSSSAEEIKFDGVQPKVDSTGRANDIFRRVSARVNLFDFPYPDAAVDITGNLCKSFSVTDTKYYPGGGDYTCTP